MDEQHDHADVEDTEGHMPWRYVEDADEQDTEGHMPFRKSIGVAGDEETEGHGLRGNVADADADAGDDVEGSRFKFKVGDAADEDVEGHLRLTEEQLIGGQKPRQILEEAADDADDAEA